MSDQELVNWSLDWRLVELEELASAARVAMAVRDRAIRRAVEEGATISAIARATGLSRSGVRRIIDRADAPRRRW